jgi:GT2 family glycosyltransferase
MPGGTASCWRMLIQTPNRDIREAEYILICRVHDYTAEAGLPSAVTSVTSDWIAANSQYSVTLVGKVQTSASQTSLDASIILVSFNTCAVLRECLEHVQRESDGLNVEVLIVDNGSRDGSPEMVETEFPAARLIRSSVNLGFGVANNIALEQAQGRYFVLLNSDAFLQPGSLKLAIAHMDTNPGCGLGGARLVGRDGHWQPSARMFPSVLGDLIVWTGLASRFPKSRLFGRFDRTWADPAEPAIVDWVPGAFSIIRPDVLETVGMFDPAFFLYYEEVDLCRRIQQSGNAIWYWPDVVVVHIGGESSRHLKSMEFSTKESQVVLWRMRSGLLYYRKHHGDRACIAKWAEIGFLWLKAIRNRWSNEPDRQVKSQNSQALIRLMKQAWVDSKGGRVSPPRPW